VLFGHIPLPVEPEGHEVDPVRPGVEALTRTGSELVLRGGGGRGGGGEGERSKGRR
jgi:hypothetical protein